jgi:hypothetical protein
MGTRPIYVKDAEGNYWYKNTMAAKWCYIYAMDQILTSSLPDLRRNNEHTSRSAYWKRSQKEGTMNKRLYKDEKLVDIWPGHPMKETSDEEFEYINNHPEGYMMSIRKRSWFSPVYRCTVCGSELLPRTLAALLGDSETLALYDDSINNVIRDSKRLIHHEQDIIKYIEQCPVTHICNGAENVCELVGVDYFPSKPKTMKARAVVKTKVAGREIEE